MYSQSHCRNSCTTVRIVSPIRQSRFFAVLLASALIFLATASTTSDAAISQENAFPSLPGLASPLAILQAPGDTTQWYVVERAGRVVRFQNSPTVSSLSTFIDIRGPGGPVDVESSIGETGMLGMAFHPDYANNGEVFLSYTVSGAPVTSRVSRFTTADGGLTLDPNSEDVIVSLPQPHPNHNGGQIEFGPDGFLYIGFGDGGFVGDPGDRAQNTSNLFGTMLRIDVDGGPPYGIPATNPNVGNALCNSGSGAAPCPEIYAWGFRNPWRWSFDSATGDLWVGDVGQDTYEEVDIVELGGNYGWRCREGAHDFDTTGVCPAGLIDPVIEYDHTVGDAITGGYVYRGAAIPELAGRYIFADYIQRKVFASTTDGQGNYGYEVLLETPFLIPSLAEDENSELLFIRFAGAGGDIRRIFCDDDGDGCNPFEAIVSLGDVNDNGDADVGVTMPGSSNVQVRDGSTDALVSNINFGVDVPIQLVVLPDLDASGDPEIAMLNEQSDGQVRVQIRDSVTGNLVKNLWYGQQYQPVSMAVVPDYSGNGFPEIAVLGSAAGTDAVRVQLRDSSTDAFVDNIFLGTQSIGSDLVSVTDTSGNGLPEMGILGVLKANDHVRTQVWDADTAAFQTNIWFGNVYQPQSMITMPDINSNGSEEVVAVGVDPNTQNIRVQARDSDTTAILYNIWLGAVNSAVDIALINDINSDGVADLAVLLETPAGTGRVRVQSGSNGAFIRNLFYANVENPAGLAVMPDYSGNGFDELAAIGENAGVRHVQILDTSTGSQVNSINFP